MTTDNEKVLLNYFNLYELIQVQDGETIIPAFEDIVEWKRPDFRYAESHEDYEQILLREAAKSNQTADDYREILLEDLIFMLEKDVKEFRDEKTDIIDKRIRVKKFINYLELRKPSNFENRISFDNEIFKDNIGQSIFVEWYEIHKNKITKADFDFIFWALNNDDFLRISVTQTLFSEWMSEWNENLIFGRIQSKVKTFTNQKKRQSLYQLTKERIK